MSTRMMTRAKTSSHVRQGESERPSDSPNASADDPRPAKRLCTRLGQRNLLQPQILADLHSFMTDLHGVVEEWNTMSKNNEDLLKENERLARKNEQLSKQMEDLEQSSNACNQQLQNRHAKIEQQSRTIARLEAEKETLAYERTVEKDLLQAKDRDLIRARADVAIMEETKQRALDEWKHAERCLKEALREQLQRTCQELLQP